MTSAKTPSLLPEEDYEAIENAVMETERGRWFLREYARRNRHAETKGILKALDRIEGLVSTKEGSMGANVPPIQLDIAEMFDAIARTKREIAELGDEKKNTRFSTASAELGAIVSDTERATQDILAAAEQLQEIAWTLRENGLDSETCDTIDEHTTNIYMACSFQDLTGQRTSKVVQVLNYLEIRLKSMMRIWGPLNHTDVEPDDADDIIDDPTADTRPDAHLLNGPQMDGEGVSQDAVDDMFDGLVVEANEEEADFDPCDYDTGEDAAAALFDAPDASYDPQPVAGDGVSEGVDDETALPSQSAASAAPTATSDEIMAEPDDGLTDYERTALFS